MTHYTPVAIVGMGVTTPLGSLESTKEFIEKGMKCYRKHEDYPYPYGSCGNVLSSKMALDTLDAIKEKEALWFAPNTDVYVGEISTQGKELERASDFYRSFNSNVADSIALANRFRGTVQSISSVCCTSLSNIIAGTKAIKHGYADMAVVGGACALDFNTLEFFRKMHLLTKHECMPLDPDRTGTVLSSGCGLLVLEDYYGALEHGRNIYGIIEGFSEHTGMSRTSSSPDEIFACMRTACFNFVPSILSMHATGTPLGDDVEIEAVRRHCEMFEFEERPKTFTWKKYLGHMLGACGAVETALTVASSPKNSVVCINSVGLNGHCASICIRTSI